MFPASPHKTIVAMIHVGALPGTPRAADSLRDVIRRAVNEARIYIDAGVDALLIENMHDLPYLNGDVGPEIVAAMTAVGSAIRPLTDLPLGVQILAAANREALAVALACEAQFIRAENFAFAHIADEGLMPQAHAGPLLRYRRNIGASSVRILADIKKKHASHALTADISLPDAAHAAEWMGADGIIITGSATGRPTAPADVSAARKAVQIPVYVGSGTTATNLEQHWPDADGFIVGSAFKSDGDWASPVEPQRVTAFMRAVAALRG